MDNYNQTPSSGDNQACHPSNKGTMKLNAAKPDFKSWRSKSDNTQKLHIGEGDGNYNLDIIVVDNSTCKASLHVANFYYGSIIGKQGSTKNRIERDTSTYIKIPRLGQEGDITILGSTSENVKEASRMINKIVISSRMRQRPSHFLSIPMNNQDIVNRFEQFKTAVLSECAGSRNLDAVLFKKATKLHITTGVMCLKDNEEVLFASKLLADAKTKVIAPLLEGHLPLKIRLKGLSCMNNDPSQINVLYGIVQEEESSKGLIQQVADGLVDFFNKAGYMRREREHVTLHVTFMNSKFLKRSRRDNVEQADASECTGKSKSSFDGTEVLNKFGDYDFGVMELKDIYLSKRHTTSSDGYYQTFAMESVMS